jgi:hypothetical protein
MSVEGRPLHRFEPGRAFPRAHLKLYVGSLPSAVLHCRSTFPPIHSLYIRSVARPTAHPEDEQHAYRLNRRKAVPNVRAVQVDIVGLQPTQRILALGGKEVIDRIIVGLLWS